MAYKAYQPNKINLINIKKPRNEMINTIENI